MAKSKKSEKSALKKRPVEQYEHKGKQRLNNPPVGLVNADTDPDVKVGLPKKTYEYDPHLDPQLIWAGKAEHTSFEIPTVSLHVHERIDPRTIIEAVRRKNGSNYEQLSLFSSKEENPPLRDAIDFYKHQHNWSNRLIAGDSLLVMNSLLEKEGLGGQVQMIYFDPPYGIKYGSNFQPFVYKRDVKDGKDEDLTAEPEMIKAFRDTWELGIHSYLTYLRDRLLLARELLTDSGSVFVQISDENVHFIRQICDEVFGSQNFATLIAFTKAAGGLRAANRVGVTTDYLVWYFKNEKEAKYRPLYERKLDAVAAGYTQIELRDGTRRAMFNEEKLGLVPLPEGSRPYMTVLMTKPGPGAKFVVTFKGRKYDSGKRWWGTTPEGIQSIIRSGRVAATENSIRFITYFEDFPFRAYTNLWSGFGGAADPVYVVQTNPEIIQRCMIMTTDPGDLVFDPTCGSGTTAFVAEQWGRRWITCDTSRVATTLAKERLMTSVFDYYELAHPDEGISSGLVYKTASHVTLKSIANNELPIQETLYDKPIPDNSKTRVSGPFTVEAVPAPSVKPVDVSTGLVDKQIEVDESVARSGETLRQKEWRDELLKSGIRGKRGQYILFSRVEPLSGTHWLHAEAETKPNDRGAKGVREDIPDPSKPQSVVISFGPEHAPLEQRQVELAWEEARTLVPKPGLIVFASFQFDPEAAKDIDETDPKRAGMTFLKVQMNVDLFTDDLKKKKTGGDSFWLVGQPDVRLIPIKSGEDKGKYKVEVLGFDYYNTKTGTIESGGKEQIAIWLLDTDYDDRSVFPRQVFFPMAGENEGWSRLARNLKAEIHEDLIEAYRGTESLPFEIGKHKCVAVKIVDDRGIESLKVIKAS